jgi:hypothetical protein
MTRRCDRLTHAERLALSLVPGEMPMSWRSADQTGTSAQPLARRPRRGLIVAIAISLFALAWVLALDLFTVRAGEPGAVFFPSGASETQAFAAIIAAGGLPVRATTSIFSDAVVWIAAAENPEFFSTIVDHGALVVINPLAFSSCFLKAEK